MGVIIRIFGTKWHDPRHWDCDFGTRTKQAPGFGGAGPGGLEEKPWRRATLPRPIAAVPSPLGPFTSEFGMGSGVASPPWPPRKNPTEEEDSLPNRKNGFETKRNEQAARTISIGRVSASPHVRLQPIEVVVCHRPSEGLRPGRSYLWGCLALRCIQRLSVPDLATRRCRWRDNRHTICPSFPVLSY